MVKEGVAVIDIGINRIKDPKTGKFRLVGDVDFKRKFSFWYGFVVCVHLWNVD